MAKQLINPLERHVEKAVLFLAVVALLYFTAMFAVTSPNQVEIAGEQVTPRNIDRKLKQTAYNLSGRIRSASVQEDIPEPLLPEFERELNPFKQGKLLVTLPVATRFAPAVPVIDPPEGGFGGADLAKVMPFVEEFSLKLNHGRSTYLLQTTIDEIQVTSNWVTVAAVFDVKAQIAELRSKYGASRTEVYLAPPDLERVCKTRTALGRQPGNTLIRLRGQDKPHSPVYRLFA